MISADGLDDDDDADVVLILLSSSSIRRVVGCDLQGKLMDLVWHWMLNLEAAAIFNGIFVMVSGNFSQML
ncbi:hypothetical protein Ccrd_012885 [Cynara cardunculus var. scolymus]|uniref:Uncharacterized protein n=1 Tax=Cynara cardunculus var. scolymus TaxID=59895 RepID=A0A103YGM6_CYNCS|nr:hypothetical protein Ccrd_012885 [Cynara cardunculus var. scolymus]